MENVDLKNETPADAKPLLAAGLPTAIWVKDWSERFNFMKDGLKIGYANSSGWFFYEESKEDAIKKYLEFEKSGVISHCR
jgi:hypothetical protein